MARNDLNRNSLYRNSKRNNDRNRDIDFKSLSPLEKKLYILADVAFGVFWAVMLAT